jgi:hypothetical protein
MPRKRVIAPELPADMPLPGMPGETADPEPGQPRRRGRPPGSRTRTTTTRARAPRATTGRAMTKAQMVGKVRDELYLWGSIVIGTWAMRDPCAEMMLDTARIGGEDRERLEAFVDRLAGMIGRNDKLLQIAASSGIVGEVAALAAIVYPVGREIFRIHGPGGHGHQIEGIPDDSGAYPAWSAAGH